MKQIRSKERTARRTIYIMGLIKDFFRKRTADEGLSNVMNLDLSLHKLRRGYARNIFVTLHISEKSIRIHDVLPAGRVKKVEKKVEEKKEEEKSVDDFDDELQDMKSVDRSAILDKHLSKKDLKPYKPSGFG